MSKKIVITSETQGEFNQRADNEHGLQRSIRTGEIGHNQFFDDTGHLSKLGASAARIASGESAWPASDEMKQKTLDILNTNRTGTPEEDYDVAVAEHTNRSREAAGYVAAEALIAYPTRINAAKAAESTLGKANPNLIFPDTHPERGSAQDVHLAAELPGAVRKTVTLDAVAAARKAKLESFAFSAEQPQADTYFPKAAEDETRAALGETIQREGIGIVRLVKGLFEKQLSRTERVIETVKTNAHDAGVKAQQQGDAKRAEQEAQKASAPIENPFV